MPTMFYVSYGTGWALLLVEIVLLFLVYRHFGLISLESAGAQNDGLPLGTEAPEITGVTAEGEPMSRRLANGKAHLVAFVSPECAPCAQVMPHINTLAQAAADKLDITLVVRGAYDTAQRMRERFDTPCVCVAEDGHQVFERYGVQVTPFAFLVDAEGRIRAKGICNGQLRLRNLLTAGGLKVSPTPLIPIPRRA